MRVQQHPRSTIAVACLVTAIIASMVASLVPGSLSRPGSPHGTGTLQPSVIPQLTNGFQANTTVISPKNGDGINDEVQFSFTTNINTVYNLSIEEDLRMVNMKSRYTAIGGNASRLIMANVVDQVVPGGQSYYNVTTRESTDGGITWSAPVPNWAMSHAYDLSIGQYAHKYAQLSIVQNKSDGSFYMVAIDDPSLVTDNCTINLFSSLDGFNWYHVSTVPTINLTGLVDFLNVAITLSTNKTELLGLATENDPNEPVQKVHFLKSRDGGYTWTSKIITSYPKTALCESPVIAVSPTTGSITVAWFYGPLGSYYYYLSRSFDFGMTWSAPLQLDAARGIGQTDTPAYQGSSAGTFKMLYEPSGLLKAFIIFNKSTLLYVESTNDGNTWVNKNKFRGFGKDVYVYAIDYLRLGDGNYSLCFTSTLNGHIITSTPGTYASSYYLRPRGVQVFNGTASGGIRKTITWNGKDMIGRFVDDAPYLARLSIKDASSPDFYPEKLETRVIVDNTRMNMTVYQLNQYFSPATSLGYLDTMDFEITPTEDGVVDLFISGPYASRAEVRVTTSMAQDFRGDVAMDGNGRMWCVYTSYEGGNGMDIYLKKSDDQGKTFSIGQPLISTPLSEDCPAIAIHGNTIYIAFQQYHPTFHLPYQDTVYDILLIRSDDLGKTWTPPVNLTAAEFFPGGPTHYLAPDIVVRENGTIIVAWCNTHGPVHRIESTRSLDGGFTFSAPAVIGTINGSSWFAPVALAVDEASGTVHAASGHIETAGSTSYIVLDFYESTTNGATWGFKINQTDYHLNVGPLRGITLDVYEVLGMPALRARYLAWQTAPDKHARVITIESMDGGASWVSGEPPVELKTVELLPSIGLGLEYSADLRSGRSPMGSIYYTHDLLNNETYNRDVFISIFTNETNHLSVPVYKDTRCIMSWDGSDFWGHVTSGIYSITIVTTDAAGNTDSTTRTCYLDSQAPVLQYGLLLLHLWSPTQNVTVPIRKLDAEMDYEVVLYYRYSEALPWTAVVPAFNGTHYNGIIPQTTAYNQVFFYVEAIDFSENKIVLPHKFYFRPNPGVFLEAGSGDVDRPLDTTMQIQVSNLPLDNITAVYLDYAFDGATTPTRVEMVYDYNTGNYTASLQGSKQRTSLSFSIHIIRVGSNTSELVYTSATYTQEYIPAFPEINITYPGNLVIGIISAGVGLAFGLMQAHGKRTSMHKLKARFDAMSEAGGLPASRDSTGDQKQFLRGRLMYNVMMAGTAATIGGGLLATFVLGSGGSAMLIAGFGMLLSALALMERVSIDSADAIYAGRKVPFLPILLNTGLIVAVLAVFMVAGPRVDWFNYYIVRESFTFGGVSIPKLWLSLITPMVTSVLFIIMSSYRDLKNSLLRFAAMEEAGDSWRVIWQAKEEAVSKLTSNVALKMLIFLVTIIFALVSTTQIGQYAEVGMLFLLPFVIAWLAVGVVAMLAIPSRQSLEYAKRA